jgi:hypothetical protein
MTHDRIAAPAVRADPTALTVRVVPTALTVRAVPPALTAGCLYLLWCRVVPYLLPGTGESAPVPRERFSALIRPPVDRPDPVRKGSAGVPAEAGSVEGRVPSRAPLRPGADTGAGTAPPRGRFRLGHVPGLPGAIRGQDFRRVRAPAAPSPPARAGTGGRRSPGPSLGAWPVPSGRGIGPAACRIGAARGPGGTAGAAAPVPSGPGGEPSGSRRGAGAAKRAGGAPPGPSSCETGHGMLFCGEFFPGGPA